MDDETTQLHRRCACERCVFARHAAGGRVHSVARRRLFIRQADIVTAVCRGAHRCSRRTGASAAGPSECA
jgi:hypothetical protein